MSPTPDEQTDQCVLGYSHGDATCTVSHNFIHINNSKHLSRKSLVVGRALIAAYAGFQEPAKITGMLCRQKDKNKAH